MFGRGDFFLYLKTAMVALDTKSTKLNRKNGSLIGWLFSFKALDNSVLPSGEDLLSTKLFVIPYCVLIMKELKNILMMKKHDHSNF